MQDPSRKVILWMIAAWVALALLIAATLYVRGESLAPAGCTSHIEPGGDDGEAVRCDVLWLPVVANGGGQ